MKISQIVESATTAGSIATVESPLGTTQSRTQKPPKSPKVIKGRKFANTISEGKMKEIAYDLQHMDAGNFKKKYGKTKEEVKASLKEEKIAEADLIVVPGMRRMKDKSFTPHEKDRRDHEVEMARSELHAAAKDAMRIFKLLKDRSEDEGIMGWQQSYITLASDYLNSVADSLEYQMNMYEMTGGVIAGGMSNFEEGQGGNKLQRIVNDILEWFPTSDHDINDVEDLYRAVDEYTNPENYADDDELDDEGPNPDAAILADIANITNAEKKQIVKMLQKEIASGALKFDEGRYYDPMGDERREQDAMDQERRDFKRREMEYELRNEPKNNYQVNIDGKSWKVFASKEQAEKAARTIERKYNKKATVHLTGASVSESSESAADKIRARIGTSGMLQNMMRRHEDYLDALNKKALSRMSDEERYNAAKTQHEIDVLAHRLGRMQKDDEDWQKTFDMMRDRINRFQSITQQGIDPEKLEKISNIKYQPTKEGMNRAVDSKGLTQQDWIKAIKQKYPDAKFVQSKMIDGPVHALLPDNSKLSWTKDSSKGVAEGKKHKCPECGGELVSEEMINEKKDACYYKVKSRYKVWPSAYASGALVKCRKKGASNWGNKSKK